MSSPSNGAEAVVAGGGRYRLATNPCSTKYAPPPSSATGRLDRGAHLKPVGLRLNYGTHESAEATADGRQPAEVAPTSIRPGFPDRAQHGAEQKIAAESEHRKEPGSHQVDAASDHGKAQQAPAKLLRSRRSGFPIPPPRISRAANAPRFGLVGSGARNRVRSLRSGARNHRPWCEGTGWMAV